MLSFFTLHSTYLLYSSEENEVIHMSKKTFIFTSFFIFIVVSIFLFVHHTNSIYYETLNEEEIEDFRSLLEEKKEFYDLIYNENMCL